VEGDRASKCCPLGGAGDGRDSRRGNSDTGARASAGAVAGYRGCLPVGDALGDASGGDHERSRLRSEHRDGAARSCRHNQHEGVAGRVPGCACRSRGRRHGMGTAAPREPSRPQVGRPDGAYRLEARLAPDAGARFDSAWEGHIDRIFKEARRAGRHEPRTAYAADALVALASDGPCKPVEVRVTVDSAALARGHTKPAERCDIAGVGPAPVSTARALLDDASVAVMTRNGDGSARTIRLKTYEGWKVVGRNGTRDLVAPDDPDPPAPPSLLVGVDDTSSFGEPDRRSHAVGCLPVQ
jgi:hypothetical protein